MTDFRFELTEDRFERSGKQGEVDIILREFVDDILDYAFERLRQNVPDDSGETFSAVNRSRVNKVLYGYEGTVGIDKIPPSKEGESEDYPYFVDQGTGLFNEGDPHWIEAEHGNVMVFHGHRDGQLIITRFVEGQPGQHFLDKTEKETGEYVRMKKRELAAIINNLL
jgi:hypothetical protein